MEFLKQLVDLFKYLATLSGNRYEMFELFGLIISAITILMWIISKSYKAMKSKRMRKDLHPYLYDDDIKKATSFYIPTQCQDRPPEIDDEYIENFETSNRSDLTKFFIKNAFKSNMQRFYLILGDAGMGKTTFLINLFLAYNSGFFPKDYLVRFIPLGDIDADIQIKKLENNCEKTILLLDAFDEDPKACADLIKRLKDIIFMVKDFRKVLITCRTQFFLNEEQQRFTIELPRFGVVGGVDRLNNKYITPFTGKEIREYLNKKYGRYIILNRRRLYFNSKRIRAKEIISMAPTLAVRPMLLDKIDDLLLSDKLFKYDFEVFEELVDLWIKRESHKPLNRTNSDFGAQMSSFLSSAANIIFINFRIGNGLFISIEQIERIAKQNNLNLSLIDFRSRSLLNRTPSGFIKFSHKTILEYFLAKIDTKERAPEHEIDFNSFNYGLKMRNQILTKSIIESNAIVFISVESSLYTNIKMNRQIPYLSIKSLIIQNKEYIDMPYYRCFPNLTSIFILPVKEDILSKSEIVFFKYDSNTDENTGKLSIKFKKDPIDNINVRLAPLNEPSPNGRFIKEILTDTINNDQSEIWKENY